MGDEGRVVTAKIPTPLAEQLDKWVKSMDRSKSWIVKQALSEWIAEQERRHELTLEALKSVDEGRLLSHEEVKAHFEERKRERRERAKAD
jgi:predicted transcriptional regulator